MKYTWGRPQGRVVPPDPRSSGTPMDSRTSREQAIKEIAERLAERSAAVDSGQQLNELLENLAQESDFESLPEISLLIRQHLEAGPFEKVSLPQAASDVPKSPLVLGYTITSRAAVVVGASLVLLVVVFVLAGLILSPGDSEDLPRSSSGPISAVSETADVIAKSEVLTQPTQVEETPSEARPTGATPIEATPTRTTPAATPSPTQFKKEYTVLSCVRWQGNQEVGLPGSMIAWQTDSDEPNSGEIDIPDADGCVRFPVFALPSTGITLVAKPPEVYSNLQIVGQAETVDGQPVAWQAIEEQGAFALATTLGEETSTEYLARFLVVAQRTFSGAVLSEAGDGIPGADVHLWSRASPGGVWDPINKTATADPDGTFVLTDTTGLPQSFYRIGVSNTILSRYVYTTTSASGPGFVWVAVEELHSRSMALLETQTALGLGQPGVADIIFNQKLEYVSLDVQEALLEPEGLDWQTVSVLSGQEEAVSKLIAVDQANVDALQARWENIELPPGTYALEIWTPENTSARVNYQVLSSGRLLDERVSYQSTRQYKDQANQWVDFSVTLNPSLVTELTSSEQVTVIAKPNSSPADREYNLGGTVLFGVGPVRFVKQQ